MTKIVINDQFWKVEKLLGGIDARAAKAAVSRSLSRAITGVAKAANKGIRAKKLVNMGVKALKRNFKVQKNIGRATAVSEMYASLTIAGKPLPLARFYARRISAGKSKSLMKQNKYGAWTGVNLYSVRVQVLGSSYIVERGFMLQKGKGGGKVILARLGKERKPVKKQFGPSAAELSQKSGLTTELLTVARTRFRNEMTRNMSDEVQRAIKKAQAAKGGKK